LGAFEPVHELGNKTGGVVIGEKLVQARRE
jgi:hypothetical protein